MAGSSDPGTGPRTPSSPGSGPDATPALHAEPGELRSFLSLLADRADEGLCICHDIPDPPYVRFTVWNDRMTELTGYTMDEINRLGWYQTLYPDATVQDRVRERMDRMRLGEDLVRENYVITRADDEKRVMNFSTSVVEAGDEGVHVLALMADVTERVEAEEALRRSEAKYRDLVDHATFGIYRSDASGRFLAVNPALVAMLGYETADELLALDMAEDLYVDPDERDRLKELFVPGTTIEDVEVIWQRKDGHPVTLRLNGRSLVDEDGDPIYEVIAEDVTRRRALEEQLRHSQKLEAVGKLTGGVAHDFNNQLTVMLGECEMALARADLDPQLRRALEEIRAAGERASDLTAQLLAFSRKEVVEPTVFSINDLLADAERMLRRLLKETIELTLRPDPGTGSVEADRGQIEQVLINLVVNARDAIAGQGEIVIATRAVTVAADETPAHVDVEAGEYTVLSVSDDGVGMGDDVRSHVFEPFFTTKETGRGTGLGLATCRAIVRRYGGFMDLETERGAGTTMKVYLPRLAERAADERAEPERGLPKGTETVLLVEDEEPVRRVAALMLERQGYTVHAAADGETALAAVTDGEHRFDLLITDMVLPGMSGRETAERIQAVRPDIRVLFMSGYTDDVLMRDRVLEKGVSFVQKPFTREKLAQKVRAVLDGFT